MGWRKLILAILFSVGLPMLLVAQCEYGPTTTNGCGGGGGDGGWQPETIVTGSYPYYQVITTPAPGQAVAYGYAGSLAVDEWSANFNGFLVMYPVSATTAWFQCDGEWIWFDASNPATWQTLADWARDKCNIFCQIKKEFRDLWEGLAVGASQLCNRATAMTGAAFLVFLGSLPAIGEPGGVLLVGGSFGALVAGYAQQRDDCDRP